MGRLPICECGYVKLWHGVVHELGKFPAHLRLVHLLAHHPRLPVLRPALVRSSRTARSALRLVLAIVIEGAWELLENSDFIINRYREGTISLDYFGDSILNSVSDTLAMVLGFVMAARLPIWVIVALALLFEIGVGLPHPGQSDAQRDHAAASVRVHPAVAKWIDVNMTYLFSPRNRFRTRPLHHRPEGRQARRGHRACATAGAASSSKARCAKR